MAQPLSKGTFAPIRRVINDDYKPADESYPMGGTVVPSVITEDPEHSGVRFPVHAEKLTGTNLVVEKDGEMKTIRVSPRAMEILRAGNRDGKRMNYEEAIKMAQSQEEAEKKVAAEKQAKEEKAAQDAVNKLPPVEPQMVVGVDLAKTPDQSVAHIGINSNIVGPGSTGAAPNFVVAEPEYMKAQRQAKPEKKGRKGKGQVALPVSTPKIPISFSSSLGVMSIMAERAFIGGPGNICLVIIQYSPEGHFFVPPQVDEPITISFQGQVYKCLTGIYYQIPGTPVMHTVYFIAKE